MTRPKTLTIGTRQSQLALWQTNYVADLLRRAWPDVTITIQPFNTRGDATQKADIPLPEVGGKGLFTAELEEALHTAVIDLAVHSLKDLPVENTAELTIGAVPKRANVQDVLVAQNGHTLDNLPPGAVIGTGSKRRAAQLLAQRPDLEIRPIRGNVDTRQRKVLEDKLYDATVLAAAGLERLGDTAATTHYLPLDLMLPAPGQGALAIQCRQADRTTLHYLAVLEDPHTRLAVTAERAFLAVLGGGCSAPVAAHATVDPQTHEIFLRGLVASADGQHVLRAQSHGREPLAVGEAVALAVTRQGAMEIMRQ